MEEISRQLDSEISREIDILSSMHPKNGEYSTTIEGIAKLYQLKLEERKLENNLKIDSEKIKSEYARFESDKEFKEQDFSNRQSEFKKRIIFDACAALIPLIFGSLWMIKGFKFEETGVLTSQTFRNFISKMRF